MANGNGTVTIREVYELQQETKAEIHSEIGDLKDDFKGLRHSFDQLEAGRVSRVEQELAKLKGQIIVYGAVALAVFTLITIFVENWLRGM